MYVDTDADDGVRNRIRFGVGFNEDASGFTLGDEQIVGPAEVDGKIGCCTYRVGCCESGDEGKQRQAGGRKFWTEHDADVESLPGGGVPGVIAAASTCQLFVGEKHGAVRGCGAGGGGDGVSVGGFGDGLEVKMAGEDGAGEGGFESLKIEGVRNHPAAMRMEMSAALAEWVRAPTLMKSTPVSA